MLVRYIVTIRPVFVKYFGIYGICSRHKKVPSLKREGGADLVHIKNRNEDNGYITNHTKNVDWMPLSRVQYRLSKKNKGHNPTQKVVFLKKIKDGFH